jgi:hypothetical protein
MKTINGSFRASNVEKVGAIVHDVFDEKLRFIVMRGPVSWCAYVGIPDKHPLSGLCYDDLDGFVDAHGGLTFRGEGDEPYPWPKGYYWYGWDYAHFGDRCIYHGMDDASTDEHDWTIDEVIEDSKSAIESFKNLMTLADKLTKNINRLN